MAFLTISDEDRWPSKPLDPGLDKTDQEDV
jgi:hypothetical protein